MQPSPHLAGLVPKPAGGRSTADEVDRHPGDPFELGHGLAVPGRRGSEQEDVVSGWADEPVQGGRSVRSVQRRVGQAVAGAEAVGEPGSAVLDRGAAAVGDVQLGHAPEAGCPRGPGSRGSSGATCGTTWVRPVRTGSRVEVAMVNSRSVNRSNARPTGSRSDSYESSRPGRPRAASAIFSPRFHASWMPAFMPCPPAGLWAWAASPARNTDPIR